MKKLIYALPVVLLGACAQLTGNAYHDEESYEDEYYTEETGLASPATPSTLQTARPTQPTPQQATLSADGTVINLPAQQIYLGPQSESVPVQPMTVSLPSLSYSEPRNIQPIQPQPIPDQPTMQAKPRMITLQNRAYPNTFAQCSITDTGCIMSYEQQGYIRLNGTPQFAGYQDTLSPSDYPQGGRWRNNNNIPRW